MPRPLSLSPTEGLAVAVEDIDGDQALVVAAQRDPRAFAPLYLRYVEAVYGYCHRRLGTKEAAEDATSLVFAKALAGLPRYRPDRSTFRSWLFTIAHNVVIDHQRAARPTQPFAGIGEVPDREPGPEVVVLAAEERRSVGAFLVEMPPDQRQVLELRLAGLTTAEIGSVLGRRPGAVRATQFRALTRLRQLLNRRGKREVADGW
jgi:RNA polymerase sigma factor (sigma-70 family)